MFLVAVCFFFYFSQMASLHEILVREIAEYPDDYCVEEVRRVSGIDIVERGLKQLDDDVLKEVLMRVQARMDHFLQRVLCDKNARNSKVIKQYEQQEQQQKAAQVIEESKLSTSNTNDSTSRS